MSHTYTSTNARPCANCGLKQRLCICKPSVPIVPGHISLPTDAWVISQDVSALQEEARVRGYLNAPTTTAVDGLSWTGVMDAIEKGPESHAQPRSGRTRAPMWALASVFVGGLLMGLCFVAYAWLAI